MRTQVVSAALVLSSVVTACSTGAAPTSTAFTTTGTTAAATPPRTSPTVAAPSGAHADYKAITQPLLLPLGALIVAVRANTPTSDYWLAQFNKSADSALQAIDGDSSDSANRLRTGIANIRARPTDLQTLEDTRSVFLNIT